MIEKYLMHVFIIIAIYVILSTSLNLTIGFTGLLNLGHIAFYAIGAYTSALLALNFGTSFWIGLLAGGLMATAFGYLLSFPTLRLRGDYLALGTLGFSFIIEAILKNWTSVTRGTLGVPGIPYPELFGMKINSLGSYSILVLIFMVVFYLILFCVVKSPFGRLLKATRDDEVATRTLGKNTFVIKAKAMCLSAFIAGVAGAIYAHYVTFIDPLSFSVNELILVLSMVLVGGTGSLGGSVVGAIVVGLLPEPLRFLPLPNEVVGGMRQAIYALLLIIIIMKRPQGILGEDTLRDMWASFKNKTRRST